LKISLISVGVNLDGYATDKWPKSSLLFTGRTLVLDFQTASNYLNVEDAAARFGFACTVTGYPKIIFFITTFLFSFKV
jgi:hypothetical protein